MSQLPKYAAVFQEQAQLLRAEYIKDFEYQKRIYDENMRKGVLSKIKPMPYEHWLEERLIKLELGVGEYNEEEADE